MLLCVDWYPICYTKVLTIWGKKGFEGQKNYFFHRVCMGDRKKTFYKGKFTFLLIVNLIDALIHRRIEHKLSLIRKSAMINETRSVLSLT